MAQTTRAQVITYVRPPFRQELEDVVAAGNATGKRVTLSSLCEEALYEGLRIVRARYVGESKPIRKTRRGKLTSV